MDQPKADQQNFFVLIRDLDTYFEINFVPRQTPTKVDSTSVTFDSPHGNVYGYSIGYDVSKDSNSITKKFFSK